MKFCSQCGTKNKEEAAFCANCGHKLSSGQSAQAQPVQQPIPQPVQQPTPQPIPQPAPQPAPRPAPQPAPQPAPIPHPAQQSAPQMKSYTAPQPAAASVPPVMAATLPTAPVVQKDPREMPMTVMGWIGTFLLLLIPLVNIFLVFIWAFGNGANKSKKSFFQAYLILMVIMIALTFLFSASLALIIQQFSDGMFNL